MRLFVEVQDEQEDPLRELAIDGHRSVREQAGYLLFLKIQEEWARFKLRPVDASEVA